MAAHLGALLRAQGAHLAVAESCTGGWLAKILTDRPGCSDWFDRGLVTYSNAAKMELLGVPEQVLQTHGAVSEATVIAMAEGLLRNSHADFTVAISGIAGPGGASPGKPVGTVWLGFAASGQAGRARQLHLHGDRDDIRRQAVGEALRVLQEMIASG